jgi:hypothetical protein
MAQRTTQEEQIRQLKMLNAQLNPGPALLRFLAFIGLLLLSLGLLTLPTVVSNNHKAGLNIGLFSSSCYPPVGGKRDPRCR